MNYWPRWIGAIRKRTMHLSLAQMGAYDRLLDHYYAEEKPLPGSLEACCRIAGAVTKAERDAVASVLAEFFSIGERGFANERADEEIAMALPKIAAAQANGKRGGRPKKPTGFPAGNPDATQDQPRAKAPHPHPQSSLTTFENAEANASAAQASPTDVGAVCLALKAEGIWPVSPHNQRLHALVNAGAQPGEFTAFASKALDVAPGRAFEYVLGAVEGERTRAAATAGKVHRGPMPSKQGALEARNAAVVAKLMGEIHAGE